MNTHLSPDQALSARALHSWVIDSIAYQTPEVAHAIQTLLGGYSFADFSKAMEYGVIAPQPFMDDDGTLKVALMVLTDDGMAPFASIGIDWCGPGLEGVFRAHFNSDSADFARQMLGGDE